MFQEIAVDFFFTLLCCWTLDCFKLFYEVPFSVNMFRSAMTNQADCSLKANHLLFCLLLFYSSVCSYVAFIYLFQHTTQLNKILKIMRENESSFPRPQFGGCQESQRTCFISFPSVGLASSFFLPFCDLQNDFPYFKIREAEEETGRKEEKKSNEQSMLYIFYSYWSGVVAVRQLQLQSK